MGKPNRGGLSTQQAENIKRVLQKKDLPTKYDDVAEDEKARLEAVLTILTLRLAQLSDNHPSPAASATAQLEKRSKPMFQILSSMIPKNSLIWPERITRRLIPSFCCGKPPLFRELPSGSPLHNALCLRSLP